VATPAQNGAGPAIDLSWQPDTGTDVAGYAVYRRAIASASQQPVPWQRISGAQPVAGPGFHDANVQPGQSYQYAVTAIGQNGVESARSATAEESVPAT
jgi:fibronectin type 3 domain-containing protein